MASTLISASDYNSLRSQVIGVLGDGSTYGRGSYGYGQALSANVDVVGPPTPAKVYRTDWTKLLSDLDVISYHQTNAAYSGTRANAGDKVKAAIVDDASTFLTNALSGRDTAHPSQLSSQIVAQPRRTSSWGSGPSGIQAITSIQFGNTTNSRYFFNQGGKIVFHGVYAYGTHTPQNDAWNTAMTNFSYTMLRTDYALVVSGGSAWTRLYTYNLGSSYYTNDYAIIDASTPDGGDSVSFRITFEDNHNNVSDFVDGTIGVDVSVVYAIGAFNGYQPSGSVSQNF